MEGITRIDIDRYLNSRFSIKWSGCDYIVRDTKWNITVAIGFCTFIDALVFLEEDAKVI